MNSAGRAESCRTPRPVSRVNGLDCEAAATIGVVEDGQVPPLLFFAIPGMNFLRIITEAVRDGLETFSLTSEIRPALLDPEVGEQRLDRFFQLRSVSIEPCDECVFSVERAGIHDVVAEDLVGIVLQTFAEQVVWRLGLGDDDLVAATTLVGAHLLLAPIFDVLRHGRLAADFGALDASLFLLCALQTRFEECGGAASLALAVALTTLGSAGADHGAGAPGATGGREPGLGRRNGAEIGQGERHNAVRENDDADFSAA